MGNRITRIIRGRRVHPIAIHDDLLKDIPPVVNDDDEDVETDNVMGRNYDEEPDEDEVSVDNQQQEESSERDRQRILELENQLAELQLVVDNAEWNDQDNQVDQGEDVISYEHGLTDIILHEHRNETLLQQHQALTQSLIRGFKVEQANLVNGFLIQKLNRELDIQKEKCDLQNIVDDMENQINTMEMLKSALVNKAKRMEQSFEARITDLRMDISIRDREIRDLKEDVQCFKHQEKHLMRRCKGIFQSNLVPDITYGPIVEAADFKNGTFGTEMLAVDFGKYNPHRSYQNNVKSLVTQPNEEDDLKEFQEKFYQIMTSSECKNDNDGDDDTDSDDSVFDDNDLGLYDI